MAEPEEEQRYFEFDGKGKLLTGSKPDTAALSRSERLTDFLFDVGLCLNTEADEFLTAGQILTRLNDLTGLYYELTELLDVFNQMQIYPVPVEAEHLYPVRRRPL